MLASPKSVGKNETPKIKGHIKDDITSDEELDNEFKSKWFELHMVGKVPSRRAYHICFYYNNQ